MKLKEIKLFLIVVACIGIVVLYMDRNYLKKENVILNQNNDFIKDSITRYKVNDSLNAVQISQLNLKNKEYREYRAKDFELISKLNVDKKRLNSVITSQTKTIYDLKMNLKPQIIVRDSFIVDTIDCMSYKGAWIEFDACIDNGLVEAKITSKDSLIYVEHVIPHKILFIKWGTKKRKQEIVSRNPHTTIVSAEFVKIRNK